MGPRSARAASANDRLDSRDLICSLGRPTFEGELVRWVHEIFDADTVHISVLQGGQPVVIMQASHDGGQAAQRQCQRYMKNKMWRFDPSMTGTMVSGEVEQSLLHLNFASPETAELGDFYRHEDVRDRVLICGPGPNGRPLQLSMIRSMQRSSLDCEQRARLSLLSGIVFPLIVKHHQLLWESRQLPHAVTSLRQIEKHLALASVRIPRREGQVLARTLNGATAKEIALELKISSETVVTYRKNLHRRLGIANSRELLLWYLRLHNDVASQLVEYPG